MTVNTDDHIIIRSHNFEDYDIKNLKKITENIYETRKIVIERFQL
jgi:hypothetical protein